MAHLDSEGAELREGQTVALRFPGTGERTIGKVVAFDFNGVMVEAIGYGAKQSVTVKGFSLTVVSEESGKYDDALSRCEQAALEASQRAAAELGLGAAGSGGEPVLDPSVAETSTVSGGAEGAGSENPGGAAGASEAPVAPAPSAPTAKPEGSPNKAARSHHKAD